MKKTHFHYNLLWKTLHRSFNEATITQQKRKLIQVHAIIIVIQTGFKFFAHHANKAIKLTHKNSGAKLSKMLGGTKFNNVKFLFFCLQSAVT